MGEGRNLQNHEAWLTGNGNMAVHLALIYHIHNFLGARDKSLRAALIKNKAQTLIHSQENKQTSVPKYTQRATLWLHKTLHICTFPAGYGCKSASIESAQPLYACNNL